MNYIRKAEIVFMNKVKLLYDVAKTMKAKEILNGVLKAEVEKD